MDFHLDVLVQAVLVGLFQSAPSPAVPVTSNPVSQIFEILKLLVLAVPGYAAARYQAKKEERTGQVTRDESLVAGFRSMSMQAREQLTEAHKDTAREREARRAAEARVAELEREIRELRARV